MRKFRLSAAAAVAVSGLWIGNAAQAQPLVPEAAPAPAAQPTAPTVVQEPITEAQPLPSASNGQLAPTPQIQPVPESAGVSSQSMPAGTYYQQAPVSYGGTYYGGYTTGYNAGGEPWKIPRDYGWERPARKPLWRTPVVYRQFWPGSYTGQPSAMGYARALPAVYQPTDTTQLGYYYQQVPMWQPNPGMLPPAPWPWDWHHMVPATQYYSRGNWRDSDYVRSRYGYGVTP